MNAARDKAVALLTHYLDLALPAARDRVELADRHAEVADIVDWIIDASVARSERVAGSARSAS